MSTLDFIFRLSLAMLLGAGIGLERQWRNRNAGLRTNALVAIGAASFLLLSESLTNEVGDPSRIAAQIVSGIGFLGAGVIMRDGVNVQGLNTAATLWCSAAVGTMTGVGLLIEAFLTTFLVVITHFILRPVGNKLQRFANKSSSRQVRPDFKLSTFKNGESE
ncbi:MgtC/SapB family protein [Xanthovirga aplysinae]|uniref:MgtC/SapB family protein n=1 Tax=Xanthovirga aplysinae TaxID=2529853 RepID=UPI0012BCD05A|nr:MgtC/SapB family protein [Xanthovirga aplysinae]MTI32804.1 MgtC/SapB family protein [Xanthovirga aplysinae]